jgi:hypothetical protein
MQPSQRKVMATASAISKRYQRAGLFIEVTGLPAGPAQGGVALTMSGLS